MPSGSAAESREAKAALANDNEQLLQKCMWNERVIIKLQDDIKKVTNNSSDKIRALIELLKQCAPEKIPSWAQAEAYLQEENQQLRSQIMDDEQVSVQKEKLIELLSGDSKADLQKENEQLLSQVLDDEQVISKIQQDINDLREKFSPKKRELIELLQQCAPDRIPYWAQERPEQDPVRKKQDI